MDSVVSDWKAKTRYWETKEMIPRREATRPCAGSSLMGLIERGGW